MDRSLCIHAHFYQPPRENPWLEEIELQDSAYPYHDWNQRITAECYAANGASRILGADGRIERIVNNYSRISFNFGPTLLSWIEIHAPDVYRTILDADEESRTRFSGHGSALAQTYNHMILPLANDRDRATQVAWGVRDFEHRFRRRPEGMWLAETAADVPTLEALAAAGLRFTILAPNQARRTRRIGVRAWRDVSGQRVDPSMPYLVRLPSGASIVVFFYDGPVARAVAFDGLLRSGEHFAARLLDAFSDARTWPQLVHIATDGETYGHHHRHGDMALAYALHSIDANPSVQLTIYGEFLEQHPPTHQAEIFDNSSWSCAHGVERWWRECGCSSGGRPGWRQTWRTPLRNAFDWLRDELAPKFEAHAGLLLRDPWVARNDYIEILLDRSADNVAAFFRRHTTRELSPEERTLGLELLEMQRHLMLMYTSCGWFFDELSGLETTQVILYADRAIQLAQRAFGLNLESPFLERLAEAKSNIAEHRDGGEVHRLFVRPMRIGLQEVGAHYAISSLFENYGPKARIFAYVAEREDVVRRTVGPRQLLVGRGRIASEITGESARLSFGVLHFGDHTLQAGVREFRGEEAYQRLVYEATDAFEKSDLPAVIRLLDQHFDGVTYSLRSLFRDEQRRVVGRILDETLAKTESSLRQIFEQNGPLLRFLAQIGVPAPPALHLAAEFTTNTDLRRALAAEAPDLERIRGLLDTAARENVALDGPGVGFALGQALERMIVQLAGEERDLAWLEKLEGAAAVAQALPFEIPLWRTQNIYYGLLQRTLPSVRASESPWRSEWARLFESLGRRLSMHVESADA